MFCRQWLAVVFCVNTLVFGCGLWQASTAVAHFKLSFSKQRLGQCQRDVLPESAKEDKEAWRELHAWCQANVYTQSAQPSYLQKSYLFLNEATVRKCNYVHTCETNARYNAVCLLMLVAVTALLDFKLLTLTLRLQNAPVATEPEPKEQEEPVQQPLFVKYMEPADWLKYYGTECG